MAARQLWFAFVILAFAGAVGSGGRAAQASGGQQAGSGPLNVIAFGAHPDDCDGRAGGTDVKWAAAGHRVRYDSVTSGDAGHQSQGGGALAARRRAEAKEAGRRIGIDYVVLDNHDGELMPELKVREQIIRLIRQWNADLVLGPRTNDYHPDHRYTGVLLQDAAFMVTVPNIASDTPALRRNPVFMFFEDTFQKPAPFTPDVAVSIDDTISRKLDMIDAHVSAVLRVAALVGRPVGRGAEDAAARRQWLATQRQGRISPVVRAALVKLYGAEAGAKVRYAEAFEISEYGRRPDETEIRRLFPFFGQ
jgi:LmbE family N-acetylglucosaminyl deacetylase